MASNQTANFGLNQWEATDKVLREEFNADNAKIDAALAVMGNCKIVSGSYIGTGTCGAANPVTLSFEGRPLLVFAASSLSFCALRGQNFSTVLNGKAATEYVNLVWGENSVSWYHPSEAYIQLNKPDTECHYVALLSAEA